MSETAGPSGPEISVASITASGSQQTGIAESGAVAVLAALCAIARFHQVACDPATLAHQLGMAGTMHKQKVNLFDCLVSVVNHKRFSLALPGELSSYSKSL